MIRKKFKDIELPSLGLGFMRLPVIDGKDSEIDIDAAREIIRLAMERGLNYFDTGWGYHGGSSEKVLGQLLGSYPRDSFFVADKFPCYDLDNLEKAEEIFEAQLQKTGLDYFDFYLLHNICEANIDACLKGENHDILNYLLRQKQLGRIRYLGFSTHASPETLERFLDAWGEHMEFCQIQLNWLDWHFQNAKAKISILNERNIPVWVMEPLRGGKLASVPEHEEQKLRSLRPTETVPGWGFRFIQSLNEVTVILSGMSDTKQLLENIKTFETHSPVNREELQVLLDMGQRLAGGVPCTGCRYCIEQCPQTLDIPRLLELSNECHYNGVGARLTLALSAVDEDKLPHNCIGCRGCEAVCPQGIEISRVLADFSEKLR